MTDPLLSLVKEKFVNFTGLNYYVDNEENFYRQVADRLSTLGLPNCSSYLQLLEDPLLGRSEFDVLVTQLTNGETYFFRHKEQLDALGSVVLPALYKRGKNARRLRIWCAGCADGPEPYSLSILLKRDVKQRFADWDVTILGTDIDRQALASAREGVFADWALRATPDDLKQTCFTRQGNLWRILPLYKQGVSFQYGNLAEDRFTCVQNNVCCFDLIMCRNVMIYFAPALIQNLIHRFYGSMAPGSWLLVGPSEHNMTFFASFNVVNAPGATLYQRPESSLPIKPTVKVRAAELAKMEPPANGTANHRSPPPASIASLTPSLREIRRHADAGAWDKALECCHSLLASDALDSRTYFYQALVLNQMDKPAEAEQSLRRAIYLDGQSVLAHYYLGLLLQSSGETRHAACRSLENALELLRSFAGAFIFEDADGISAHELTQLAQMNLKRLLETNENNSH